MTRFKKILLGLMGAGALFFIASLAYGVSPTRQELGGTATSTKFTTNSIIYQDANGYAGATVGSGLSLSGGTLTSTGGSGNSAFTIGNGTIYNATSTDLVGIGTITPTTTLYVQGKGGTNPLTIASSTGTSLLTVTQAGNVGIGTTTPGTGMTAGNTTGNTFQVTQVTSTGKYPFVAVTSADSSTGAFFEQQNDTGATNALDLGTYGSTNALSAQFGLSRANLSSIFKNGNSPLVVGTLGTGSLTLGTNNAANVTILNGGNVGIGTTTPPDLLSVQATSGNLFNGYNGATSEFQVTSAGSAFFNGKVGIGTAIPAAYSLATNGALLVGTSLDISTSNNRLEAGNGGVGLEAFGSIGTTANANVLKVYNQASAIAPASSVSNILLVSTTGAIAPTASGAVNGILFNGTVNQTSNTATGITRGLLINPQLSSSYDYRNFEVAATSSTLSNANPVSNLYNVLFNPITYQTASTTKYTIATSSTVTIAGAPVASTTSLALTNSIGLQILGNAVTASTTNAYGAYINAPTGATNNYALGVNGHTTYTGATPAISSCGATPNGSATGNDSRFTITIGGGVVTACTATFVTPFKNTPVCVLTDNSAGISVAITSASNSAITITSSAALGGGIVYVHCDDYQ